MCVSLWLIKLADMTMWKHQFGRVIHNFLKRRRLLCHKWEIKKKCQWENVIPSILPVLMGKFCSLWYIFNHSMGWFIRIILSWILSAFWFNSEIIYWYKIYLFPCYCLFFISFFFIINILMWFCGWLKNGSVCCVVLLKRLPEKFQAAFGFICHKMRWFVLCR